MEWKELGGCDGGSSILRKADEHLTNRLGVTIEILQIVFKKGISNILKRPFGEVKEDVFGQRFTGDEHRLFKKLRRDMLK